MAEQPLGKHVGDPGKRRRAAILKGVIAVLLLVAVGCGGYVLYMHHLDQKGAEEISSTDPGERRHLRLALYSGHRYQYALAAELGG